LYISICRQEKMQKSVIQTFKTVFLVMLFLVPSFILKAHEYYFAFAEVEYNEKSLRIEATLIISAHDFEEYLKKHNTIQSSIEKSLLDTNQVSNIMQEINNHFIIQPESPNNNSQVDSMDFTRNSESFQLDGYNLRLDGNLELYLSKGMRNVSQKLNIIFNLLMNEFPEQQNKLSFTRRCEKSTFNFTLTNHIYSFDFY